MIFSSLLTHLMAAQPDDMTIIPSATIVATTFMVGTALYYALVLLNVGLPYIYCLVFGALIAPTDPVAVLAILKSVKAPKSLETKIAGESLFNDGVGVVLFLVLVEIAAGGDSAGFGHVALLFLQEAAGGVLFGFVIEVFEQ